MSKINSYHSSHTGDNQYSIQQKEINSSVINYCGVPEIIEIIKANNVKIRQKIENIICIGSWNPVDNPIIYCLLCRRHLENKFLTPYTVRSLQFPQSKKNENKKGFEIQKQNTCIYKGKCIFKPHLKVYNICKDERENVASTNRIIRTYDGFGSKEPHNINRIDWINKLDEENDKNDVKELLKIEDFQNKAIHIVIEDHGMGVLSKSTISGLCDFLALVNKSKEEGSDGYKEVCWHIRTKMENPEWLSTLFERLFDPKKKEELKNNYISTIVNDFKIKQREKGIRKSWFGSTISRSSLEHLGHMVGLTYFLHEEPQKIEFKNVSQSAAILLEDNSIIGVEMIESEQSGQKYNCFLYNNSTLPKQQLTIGRTRKFFTAIVIKKIISSFSENPKLFHEICNEASNFAYCWSDLLRKKWDGDNPNVIFDYSKIIEAIFEDSKYFNTPLNEKCQSFDYDQEWIKWNDSSKNLGIVEYEDEKKINKIKKQFDLWRGFGSLEDYITIGGGKRSKINDLINEINNFSKQPSPEHSLSCLITAAPGWGKSFLAKCAAKKFKLEYLEFSISQMATSKDIIGCFATISSVQSRNKDKKLLIFIDEINAEVEGHSIIPLLLSPIWDGIFINDGRSYRIDPCIWLFASTSDLYSLSNSKNNNKGSDFASRLNGPILELDRLGAGDLHSTIKDIREDINKFTEIDIDLFYKILGLYEEKIIENHFDDFFGSNVLPFSVYSQILNDKSYHPNKAELENYKNSIDILPTVNNYLKYLSNGISKVKTEQIYIMINYLNNKHKPIKQIDQNVLNLFYNILPINGIRSLEFFADSFEEIENNAITSYNVPNLKTNQALKRHILVPIGWFDKDSKNKHFCKEKPLMIDINI